MRRAAACLVVGLAAMACTARAADTRHYDCSKAGNANKAACKAQAPSASATPAATASSVPAPSKTRTYDCSKAGNKNKTACKSQPVAAATPAVAAPAAPPATVAKAAKPAPSAPATGGAPRVVAWTQKNGKVVHYDCSKAGNFNKKACKS